MMRKVLKIISVTAILFLLAVTVFYFWAKSPTVQLSDNERLYTPDTTISEIQNNSIINVLSYNIGYLSGMTNNLPMRPLRDFYARNETRVIPALRATDADIIGFQEIDYDSKRSYRTNQAEMICDSLSFYGAFAVNWNKQYVPFPAWPLHVQFGKMLSGQAVTSRYPILEQHVHTLEKVASNSFFYNAFYLDRLAQVATIAHPLTTLKVINVHAEAFDAETRRRQLDYIYELFWELEKENPVILIGDFNSDPAVPDEYIHRFINDNRLSFAAINEENSIKSPDTYPSDNPSERLDYIIVHSARFEIIESRIATEFGDISDHLPCSARLKIK